MVKAMIMRPGSTDALIASKIESRVEGESQFCLGNKWEPLATCVFQSRRVETRPTILGRNGRSVLSSV